MMDKHNDINSEVKKSHKSKEQKISIDISLFKNNRILNFLYNNPDHIITDVEPRYKDLKKVIFLFVLTMFIIYIIIFIVPI